MADRIEACRQLTVPLDPCVMAEAAARWDTLTKPRGSLGRLETLACQVAGISGSVRPRLTERLVFVLAGDHGVTAEGVSAYPSDVTAQMLYNFVHGGAAINVLARQVGARVVVVDMGVGVDLPALPELVSKKVHRGTRNFVQEPAMTPDQALTCVETGIELAEAEVRARQTWVVTGDMGIGNTTASSAIIAAMTGEPVERVTGRGTGVSGAALARKAAVIKEALDKHQPRAKDALDVLCKVGGFEIGGLAGIVLGAAARHCPVVLDGLIATAAALLAVGLVPTAREYLIAGHRSAEPGHSVALQALGLEPVLDLELRLGEGTGGVLALPVLEAACRLLDEMATFEEAGVATDDPDQMPSADAPS
ncbi:MAG TPA: nicotinate-nucleotide--dimethylbenzimidazole phosphoribosyltransferase [Candidatus Tectomicrobia bacterium]|nr:nicotinate-nucleotide--dimethylbenzimidazole phosphoribosyltransferase [Candidatus Tectomicrobia bacterium]